MRQRVPTVVAVASGGATLLGYFVGPGFRVHLLFVRWAAALAAAAFVLGVVNLLVVHGRRIVSQERDWPYSTALLFSFVAVIAVAAAEHQGPSGAGVAWVFRFVLAPLEAATASLLAVFLVSAAFRAMRKRPSLPTSVFVATIILVLLAALPLPGEVAQVAGDVRCWLVHVFSAAGARGMLLGVALGTIAAGIRVLVGIDQPHSERDL